MEHEIPKIKFKQYQDYIVHIVPCSYAEIITSEINKVIDYIKTNNLEITEIKFERNFNGFNDYRIITRKKCEK